MSALLDSLLTRSQLAQAQASDDAAMPPLPRGEYPTAKWPEGLTHLPPSRPINAGHVARWLETLDHGALLIEAKKLALDAALAAGYGHTPQASAHVEMLILGDTEVPVEFKYSAGSPGRTYGPPENCYESEPEEVNLMGVFINGQWIDVDVIAEDVRDRWVQAICDKAQENREAAAEERAAAERDYA
jgi:hypothetical protein